MVNEKLKSFQTKKGVSEFLTRHEVLELFKISHPTLREWQRQGLIKGTKIGRRVYFTVDEINALFNDKTANNG